jgi:hypothetical protein
MAIKTLFLAINAKGDRVLAQSKRTTPPHTTTPISKFRNEVFQLVSYDEIFKRRFFNWLVFFKLV